MECEMPRTRKRISMFTRYPPPPHSKSWNEVKDKKTKKPLNCNRIPNKISFDTPCQRFTAMRRQMQQRFRGPEPSLPHLKYGVFPKRPNRAFPEKIEGPMKTPTVPDQAEKRERKSSIRKAPDTELVIFKTLPLDRRLMRQLSISASTHVDIKPQRYSYLMTKTLPPAKVVRSSG